MAVFFWLVIIVASAWAEFHTRALVGAFVALGGLCAFVAAVATAPFWLQALIWLVVSFTSTASLRPFALSRYGRHAPGDLLEPVSATMTGQVGVVQELVGDDVHPGRVIIRSESWRAVTDGAPLLPTTPIVVTKVYGTTLWVEPRELSGSGA